MIRHLLCWLWCLPLGPLWCFFLCLLDKMENLALLPVKRLQGGDVSHLVAFSEYDNDMSFPLYQTFQIYSRSALNYLAATSSFLTWSFGGLPHHFPLHCSLLHCFPPLPTNDMYRSEQGQNKVIGSRWSLQDYDKLSTCPARDVSHLCSWLCLHILFFIRVFITVFFWALLLCLWQFSQYQAARNTAKSHLVLPNGKCKQSHASFIYLQDCICICAVERSCRGGG